MHRILYAKLQSIISQIARLYDPGFELFFIVLARRADTTYPVDRDWKK